MVERRGFTAFYGQSLNPILKYCLAVKVKLIALVIGTPHKRFTATPTAGWPLPWNEQGTGTQMGREAPSLCLCKAAPQGSLMPILCVFCFASHPLIVFRWGVLFCFVFLWFEICILKKQSGAKNKDQLLWRKRNSPQRCHQSTFWYKKHSLLMRPPKMCMCMCMCWLNNTPSKFKMFQVNMLELFLTFLYLPVISYLPTDLSIYEICFMLENRSIFQNLPWKSGGGMWTDDWFSSCVCCSLHSNNHIDYTSSHQN